MEMPFELRSCIRYCIRSASSAASDLHQEACVDAFAVDVIGILDYIGAIEEIKTRGRPTKKRNIQLLLEENKSVQTILWGDTAQQIDDDFYKTNKGPFIVIFTSTIVKTFRGDYQLSFTFATKLYVNLDIPEVAEIRNKCSQETLLDKTDRIMKIHEEIRL
ncbi:hypothetical protein SO802_017149 [Lithocarpus litseifolius]|uniref:Replication protein A OB domain-containing protein n=1 Tax=Lithocarpus litseifolius TaxID=425828 RepID=A0AAW2D110_9ROSI